MKKLIITILIIAAVISIICTRTVLNTVERNRTDSTIYLPEGTYTFIKDSLTVDSCATEEMKRAVEQFNEQFKK